MKEEPDGLCSTNLDDRMQSRHILASIKKRLRAIWLPGRICNFTFLGRDGMVVWPVVLLGTQPYLLHNLVLWISHTLEK